MIEEAAQLWAAGDREKAFEVLCCVWAETQDLELGELCEQISELLVRERVSSLAREQSPEHAHASLIAAAKAGDRTAVHALLPWLIGLARPKARQRLVFLEPPDPVLLHNLAYWLQRRPELNELAGYLVQHRSRWLDVRNTWWVRDAMIDRYTREARTRVRLGPSARSLASSEGDTLKRLRVLVDAESPVAQSESLFEAVCEQPDDDHRRVLWAESLLRQDAQDPRGEFIKLQLRAAAGSVSESDRAREQELLDLHGLRWLGPLVHDCFLPSVRFRRGFLHGLDLGLRRWRENFGSPGHPIWATVEVLNGGTWAIVSQPIMRSLRLLGCDPSCARAVLGGPIRPQIEALSLSAPDHGNSLSLAHELFARLDAVPNLRHLRLRDSVACDPTSWQWLWQGPRSNLESVRLRVRTDGPLRVEQWCEMLRRDRSRVELLLDHGKLCFALLPSDGYRTVRVSHTVPRWCVPPSREEWLAYIVGALEPSLRAAELRRIEIVGSNLDMERLRVGLGHDTLELVAV